MSCVMCHMSPVTCHMSRVTCHIFLGSGGDSIIFGVGGCSKNVFKKNLFFLLFFGESNIFLGRGPLFLGGVKKKKLHVTCDK